MIVTPPQALAQGGLTSIPLSDAGGITQFGLHLQSLDPGASTGKRHWHTAEDEMVFVLEGQVTLLDDAGETALLPGQAACFRRGDPNGHALANRGAAPCRFVMIGARARGDICTYDDGTRQVNAATDWHIESPFGERIRGGALPPHLLNLAAPWGEPPGAGSRVIRPGAPVPARGYAHPILGGGLGDYDYHLLSDPGGLTQFGCFVEILPPGSRSAFRHWHEAEDEMVHVLDGHPTLIEDQETALQPGDTLAWARGAGPAHCLQNRTDRPARYLVAGTRLQQDRIHHPDHGLITEKDGTARRYLQEA
jgi:uncharacterized cupin superfamily protein